MKKIDPSIIFVLFAVFAIAGFTKMPFLMVAAIGYVVYKISRQRSDERDERRGGRRRYDDRRSSREYRRREYREPSARREAPRREPPRRKAPVRKPKRNNPFKASGVSKFKDYDYNGAIEDFKKALDIDSEDIAVQFNIACTYSLTEEKDKAFYHLSEAVKHGFKDFDKIRTHDALAFLRIQDEYESFEQNGFRWRPSSSTVVENNISDNSNLLEQLKQLAELREKGLLTEEEFLMQKKKLLK